MLEGDEAAKTAFLKAVQRGVITGVASVLQQPEAPHHNKAALLKRRRLEALRELQSAGGGVAVKMDFAPGGKEASVLGEVLKGGKEEIGAAVGARLRSVPELEKIRLPGTDIEVSITISWKVQAVSAVEAAEAQVENLLANVQDLMSNSLNQLASGNGSISIPVPGLGTLFAAKLEDMSPSVKNGEVEIELPTSFFSAVPPVEGDEVVFSAISVESDTAEQMGGMAAAVLDLSLLNAGSKIKVGGLAEPVEIKLPVSNNVTGIMCAYWDEDAGEWSTRGVRISAHSGPDGGLVCETTHFSLFGAVLSGMIKTFLCANFDMFSREKVLQVFEGDWHWSLGAWIYYLVVSFLALLFLKAALVDFYRFKKYQWTDEFFLVAMGTQSNRKPDPEEMPDTPPPPDSFCAKMKAMVCGVFALAGACCSGDAVKEALDDICSTWFEQFDLVREAVENICRGAIGIMQAPTCSFAVFLRLVRKASDKAAEKLLLANARRRAAASMGMSPDLLAFVLEDEDLASYLTESRQSQRENARVLRNSLQSSAGLQEFQGLRRNGTISPRCTSPTSPRCTSPRGTPPRGSLANMPLTEASGHGSQASLGEQDFHGLRKLVDQGILTPQDEANFDENATQEHPPNDEGDMAQTSSITSPRVAYVHKSSPATFASTGATQAQDEKPDENAGADMPPGMDSNASPIPTPEVPPPDVAPIETPPAPQAPHDSRGEHPEEARPKPQSATGATRASEAARAACWRKDTDQFTAWSHLRDEVNEVLLARARQRHSKWEAIVNIGHDLIYHNPIGEIFAIDIHRSAKEKAVILAAELLGSFVLVAVFFQGAGMAKPKDQEQADMCSDDDDEPFGARIGRFIVIALASLFIAGMPVTILESLMTKGFKKVEGDRGSEAWRRQLKAWKIQRGLFWIFAVLYLCFCLAFLLVFIANIDADSHWDFTFAGGLGVVQDLLAFPLMVALLIPTAARCWLRVHARATNTTTDHLVRRACVSLHRNTNMMLPMEQV